MPVDANPSTASDGQVVEAMRRWMERAVIGLNLCPFAKSVHVRDLVRYVVSPATDTESLAQELHDELVHLDAADPTQLETTLLIAPHVLSDFLEFNDFQRRADDVLHDLRLHRHFQIATFHPHFRFANTAANDIGNCTNRAPFPTLHLLREASVARAVASVPDAAAIYARNIETLERLGHSGWSALMASAGCGK